MSSPRSQTVPGSGLDPSVAAARLRSLAPIDQLTQSAFRDLLRQTSFRSLVPGNHLYRAGEREDWTFFLIDGTLELFNGSNVVATVQSGTPRAQRALEGNASHDSARAASPCMVAKVPTSLLDMLGNGAPVVQQSYEVTEFSEEDQQNADNRLLYEIYNDFSNDQLQLPSLPDIAIRIREALQDPEITVKEVERIVVADPAVAARLVQVANSPAYAGVGRVESCRDAVVRLGLTNTRDLVTSLLMKQLFRSESKVLASLMYEVWEHSTLVAAISSELAKRRGRFSSDRALLAGLVHDIGALPILAAAARYESEESLSGDDSDLRRTLIRLRGEVGSMVLRRWEFPEDLVTVAAEAEAWQRDGREAADYCDLVMIAQLFSFAGTPEFGRHPRPASLPAFHRVMGDDTNAESTLETIREARTSISELQRILSG